FQAEDGIRDRNVTGVQTCALPIYPGGVNAGAEGFGLREQDITYNVGITLAQLLNADPRFEARTSRTSPDEVLGYDNNSSLATRRSEERRVGKECRPRSTK